MFANFGLGDLREITPRHEKKNVFLQPRFAILSPHFGVDSAYAALLEKIRVP
jgi:hypothetical protein